MAYGEEAVYSHAAHLYVDSMQHVCISNEWQKIAIAQMVSDGIS